jgi:hypothetical protein
MIDEYNTYLGNAYRFITFEGLFNTIENSTLRFSRVDNINDPLDSCPYLVPMEWGKFSKLGGQQLTEFTRDYLNSIVYRSLFICCFCKDFNTESSYLMWSHYGQSHTQVCFEIDFSMHNFLGGPSIVSYPADLVTERNNISSRNEGELGLYLITNKSKVWSYENEVRLVVDLKHPGIDTSRFKMSSNNLYLYWNFDLSFISRVVFGINAELLNIKKTHELFQKRNLQPIFEKMYIDPINLTLRSQEYKFN